MTVLGEPLYQLDGITGTRTLGTSFWLLVLSRPLDASAAIDARAEPHNAAPRIEPGAPG